MPIITLESSASKNFAPSKNLLLNNRRKVHTLFKLIFNLQFSLEFKIAIMTFNKIKILLSIRKRFKKEKKKKLWVMIS
jgi:hypothetical protein